MSTRAIIARQTEEGWQGAYHHSDGYPTWLGKRLLRIGQTHFAGDIDAMLRFIVDDHPGGWSSLGSGDPTHSDIGYHEAPERGQRDWDDPSYLAEYRAWSEAPRCYCHGDRSEGTGVYTQADQGEAWDIEWTYFLTPEALLVFKGCKEMEPVGRVEWSADPEAVDWAKIACGENFERCTHYAWVHFPEAKGLRVSTEQWLGRAPLEHHDVIGYRLHQPDGSVIEVTTSGSGRSEGFAFGHRLPGERTEGTRWISFVTYADGSTSDIFAFDTKTDEWCPGVEPIWPALPRLTAA